MKAITGVNSGVVSRVRDKLQKTSTCMILFLNCEPARQLANKWSVLTADTIYLSRAVCLLPSDVTCTRSPILTLQLFTFCFTVA